MTPYIIRTAVTGPLILIALLFVHRILGKRTLANLNSYDLLVDVALGSMVATILLTGVPIRVGLIALAVPLALQMAIAFVTSRSRKAERLVKDRPSALFFRGKYQTDVMKHQLISEAEVRRSVRKSGLSSMGDVDAVVFETDGTLSVLKKSERTDFSALQGVAGPHEQA